jgi:hypothetical protein
MIPDGYGRGEGFVEEGRESPGVPALHGVRTDRSVSA